MQDGDQSPNDHDDHNSLTLNIANILHMPQENIFSILGDMGDKVNLTGGTFASEHTETHNGVLYNVYVTDHGAVVVESDLTINALVAV